MNLSILGHTKGFIYLFTLLGCFLVFRQSDLTHTYTSSYAYLNGHFADFYDYNQIYMGRNDYLPSLYVIFAIWNIPLKLLGFLPIAGEQSWMITSAIEVAWSKLLLTLFFAACVVVLDKISVIISKENIFRGGNAGVLFATSPFVIFTVFIFSQYDIIGVFFTLLGYYFYLNKRFLYFSLLFSIAISFKYFAFIIYVPLILLIEKRVIYLIGYLIIGWLFTLIQVALYWHSNIFVEGIFSLASGKTGDAMGRPFAYYLAAIYVLMCAYAFYTKIPSVDRKGLWYRNAILLPVFAYALMFSIVRWHPHWMVIVAPFTCLSYLLIGKQKCLAWLEIAAYIGFIVICFNTWERNVDITMAFDGVFAAYIPHTDLIGRDILGRPFMGLSRTFFYLYLYSPFLILGYEKRYILIMALQKLFGRKISDSNFNAEGDSPGLSTNLLYGRAYLGTLFLGTILLICILASPDR